MNKIYVLTEVTPNKGYGGYDKTEIIGVFATYEVMKAFMEANPTRSWAYYYYSEYKVI